MAAGLVKQFLLSNKLCVFACLLLILIFKTISKNMINEINCILKLFIKLQHDACNPGSVSY